MINFRNLDFRKWAVVSLLALWASIIFSIALMEIAFVCALVFWIGWHAQLRKGTGTFLGTGTPPMAGEPVPFSARGRTRPTICGGQKGGCPPKIDWALWAPLALFLILVLVSYFTSEYPKESFRGIFKIAKPLLVFVMVGSLFRDPKSQKWFDSVFLATFLVLMIDSSVQYAFGKDLLRGFAAEPSSAGLRIVGPFGNFAKLATNLVLVIPVFGMRFLSDFSRPPQRWRSFLSLGLALSGLLLLYLTRCRAPAMALLLSLGFLCIYMRWFKVLGIALVLCLALLAAAPRSVIIHEDAQGKEQSIVERFELWKRALDVIEARPWTGTGINTYNVAHKKYDKEQNWRVRGYYAHNGYLQLAAEIGLPGIFFFLWFLFMFLRRSLQAAHQVRGSPVEYIQLGFLTGLLAFLIYAAGDNNLQSPPSLMAFWFLAGMLRAHQNTFVSETATRPWSPA